MSVKAARSIGRIVRDRRKNLGLTQCELAARAGVSERLVVSLELGDAPGIRFDKLSQVLEALGLSLSVSGVDEEATRSPGVLGDPAEEERYARAFAQAIGRLERPGR